MSSVLSHSIFAQTSENSDAQMNFLERLDSINTFKISRGKSVLTPFIAPSYTPELEFLVSAGGLFTFALDSNRVMSRSSVPFSIGYSSNGSLQASIRANIYGNKDKYRIIGEFWKKDMPDNYYGVGFDKADSLTKGKETTHYNRNWTQFKFTTVFKLVENLYIGVNYDLSRTKATDVNPVMAQDENYLRHPEEIVNQGWGLVVQYDSRDMPTNAYKGSYIEIKGTNYNTLLRGETSYYVTTIDFRKYFPIRPRKTLAVQLKNQNTFDDVPWTDYAQLGTPYDLRGYPWGKYRDRYMTFLLTEYRHMFQRKKPNKKGSLDSAHGMVAWAGTGTISNDLESIDRFIPNLGVGYRLELQPRMNLRLDYGWGQDVSSFYFSFNEAF